MIDSNTMFDTSFCLIIHARVMPARKVIEGNACSIQMQKKSESKIHYTELQRPSPLFLAGSFVVLGMKHRSGQKRSFVLSRLNGLQLILQIPNRSSNWLDPNLKCPVEILYKDCRGIIPNSDLGPESLLRLTTQTMIA